MTAPRNLLAHARTSRQAGMAVITALLVVAAVAVLVAGMIERQSTQVRMLESEQARAQARWLLAGGMDWARATLRGDARRSAVTHNAQLWATPITDLRISQQGDDRVALFSGRAEDEQGKYNLQNLAQDGQIRQDQVAAFERLLQWLRLPEALAPAVAERIASAQARPASAQSGQADGARATDGAAAAQRSSTGTTPTAAAIAPGVGGRAPGAPRGSALAPGLQAIDGLRGLRGLDPAVIDAMRPYLTVLPVRTPLNVNTARAEVLAMLSPALSLAQTMALVEQRERGQYFNNRADFINRLANPEVELPADAVVTDSDWFGVLGTLRLDRAAVDMQALLHRSGQNLPRVIWMMEIQ